MIEMTEEEYNKLVKMFTEAGIEKGKLKKDIDSLKEYYETEIVRSNAWKNKAEKLSEENDKLKKEIEARKEIEKTKVSKHTEVMLKQRIEILEDIVRRQKDELENSYRAIKELEDKKQSSEEDNFFKDLEKTLELENNNKTLSLGDILLMKGF